MKPNVLTVFDILKYREKHIKLIIIRMSLMQGGLYKSGDLEVSCGAAPLAYIMERVGGSAVLTPGTCILI